MRWLTALPVYNEAASVLAVLDRVARYSPEILVVNDGSTDDTTRLLGGRPGLLRIDHPQNRGYGAAIRSAFDYAVAEGYDVLVTIDCDGQHEPARIPVLLEALGEDTDIVSGSRYLRDFRQDDTPPADRQSINRTITEYLNGQYAFGLTDSFCGFKAYRCGQLAKMDLTEDGWGMPLELWVQAARLGLHVAEVAVPRLYLDPERAFGGILDDPQARLAHYCAILAAAELRAFGSPGAAAESLGCRCP